MASKKCLALFCAVLCCTVSSLAAGEMRTHTAPGLGTYDVEFFPDGTYDGRVKSPTDFLGFELGARPATHPEILRYFQYLDEEFSNAMLFEYARSYEGRELVYLVVTSEENAADLEGIRRRIGRLADPRRLEGGDKEAADIAAGTPAVAWMAYAIHGDELSSSDAALQLAYQLIAGTDPVTEKIRNEVVVCIDPLENPDGRTRWLGQLTSWNSVVPSADIQSLHHRGFWPYGRGNHYLFDLNRDWFVQVHPESRGRSEAILAWNPQFLLDCHEMGPLDTYLFSPPREPFNPYMISQIHKWWDIYAEDQAAAFDRYGWSYYTREWNEEFFPGYGSSWGIYIGAIGMLYEQAGVDGSRVKRRDGTVMTYRETVHHQFISSIANLATTADRRRELLDDFYLEKKRAVDSRRGKSGAFVFPPAANESRLHRFVTTLRRQNIEVDVATEPFRLRGAMSSTGEKRNVSLPAGTVIVRLAQPLRALIEVILAFDIRIPTAFLEIERKEILKNKRTKLYEATGWSMPLAYNLESYFVASPPRVSVKPFDPVLSGGGLTGPSPKFGYAFDNTDDRSYALLTRLFEKGYKIWSAREPFEVDGKTFPRGSFLIRRSGNPALDEAAIARLAEAEGVEVFGVNTALGSELADLGGREFALLEAPRIGLVGGSSVSTYEFGSVWHLLDSRLRCKTTTLDATDLVRLDLRKYNVIVLPSTWRDDVYNRFLGEKGIESLKSWVEGGGTLIAMGNGAAFLADSSVAVSAVRQKRQVLKDIREYEAALRTARAAESPSVDSADVWDAVAPKKKTARQDSAAALAALEEADELARKLRPRGVILAAVLDDTHWLGFGAGAMAPVMLSTSYAYLAKGDVQVAARLDVEANLRLSGLLWPEARKRWSETAYATREKVGSGQVILFAGQPNFRAYFHGSERMLLNALMLGPGFGTSRPLEW